MTGLWTINQPFIWEKIKLSQFFLAVNVRLKKASPLNIQYKDIKIKQYIKVTYLPCLLDGILSGEFKATRVRNKEIPD